MYGSTMTFVDPHAAPVASLLYAYAFRDSTERGYHHIIQKVMSCYEYY